ncbi:hypothetical protein J3459_017689 [Metarhizium acridum]|nr:hypothetical protein J3459_017689 [Metarhizium acridum]
MLPAFGVAVGDEDLLIAYSSTYRLIMAGRRHVSSTGKKNYCAVCSDVDTKRPSVDVWCKFHQSTLKAVRAEGTRQFLRVRPSATTAAFMHAKLRDRLADHHKS